MGLTEAEVLNRRKKWGRNEMAEAKENLVLKFVCRRAHLVGMPRTIR